MSSFLPLFLSFLQLLSFMHYNLCFKYPFFPQKPYQPLRTPVINPKSQDGEPKVSEKELYVCFGVGIRVYNSYHISAIHIFPLAPSTWTHQSELSLTLSSACFLVPTLCLLFPTPAVWLRIGKDKVTLNQVGIGFLCQAWKDRCIASLTCQWQ